MNQINNRKYFQLCDNPRSAGKKYLGEQRVDLTPEYDEKSGRAVTSLRNILYALQSGELGIQYDSERTVSQVAETIQNRYFEKVNKLSGIKKFIYNCGEKKESQKIEKLVSKIDAFQKHYQACLGQKIDPKEICISKDLFYGFDNKKGKNNIVALPKRSKEGEVRTEYEKCSKPALTSLNNLLSKLKAGTISPDTDYRSLLHIANQIVAAQKRKIQNLTGWDKFFYYLTYICQRVYRNNVKDAADAIQQEVNYLQAQQERRTLPLTHIPVSVKTTPKEATEALPVPQHSVQYNFDNLHLEEIQLSKDKLITRSLLDQDYPEKNILQFITTDGKKLICIKMDRKDSEKKYSTESDLKRLLILKETEKNSGVFEEIPSKGQEPFFNEKTLKKRTPIDKLTRILDGKSTNDAGLHSWRLTPNKATA